MPDVPERCPKCGETERHYWCRCGTLIKGTVCPMCDRTQEEAMKRERADDSIPLACGTEVTPDGRVIREGEVCLRRQRDAARAEAERWKQQYESLRAGVERVVQDLHKRAYSAARDWQQSDHHPYHDGASDAYYEAARMVQLVRRVLGEAGGGKRD